jgi:hypothetical protein
LTGRNAVLKASLTNMNGRSDIPVWPMGKTNIFIWFALDHLYLMMAWQARMPVPL